MAQTFSLQEALEEQKPTEQTTFSLEDALGPKIRSKERSWGDAALDVPAVGLSGVGSLLRVPGQLIKLAPGLQGVGEAIEAPGKAIAEFGEGLKSEGLKVREALRSEAISEAEKEGILSEFVTALKYTIKDPALLSSFFIEQLPLLIGPAGAAKAVQIAGMGAVRAAGKGLTGEAAELATKEAAERLGKRATGAAVGAGTAMQTADIASETFDRAYDVAIKQGMSKEEANDAALNAARLATPGAALTSLIATKGLAKLGGAAIERRLAGLPGTGRLRTAGGEAISEGLEEAGGALAGNIGVRTVDPTQSLTAGVGSAAGLGVLGGGVLGGVLGGKAKPELAPGQLEGENLYQTARRLHTEIGELDALAEKAKEQENRQLVELKTDAEVANLYRTEGVEGVERYQKELLQKSVAVEATPEERERAKQASSAATKLMKQIDTSNVIAHRDLMAMGVSQKDRLYKELIGKDMVADSSPIINSFAKALSRPDLSQQQRENISAALTNINEYVGSGGVDSRNVGESVRRSLGLVGVAPERPAARGVEGTAPAGVAPTEEYAGEPLGRAAVKPSPIGEGIEKAPRAAPTAPITEEVQAPPAAPAAETVARREPTQATEESAVERFAPEEVEKARVPDYKSRERLIEMPIDEFLQLADTVYKGERLSFMRQKMDNARDLVRRNVPFSSLPMLMYSDGRVDGHEGRHRALALREAGYKTMPVRLRSSDIRWDRQNDPSDLDYIRQWPTRLQAQENAANPNFSIPFPVKREDSARPYEPVKRSLKPETEKRAEEILRQQDEEERQAKQAPETAEPVAEKTRVEQFAEARKDLVNQLDGVLKRILAKYGLKDVKLNINEAMEDEGSYARQIITLALNVDNPVRVLRHESIHALKDMGFFAPAQWNALVKRANEEWIDVLKNTVYNEATGASRYDAYQDLFAAEGANKGLKGDALTKYINESIVEEAIADAFGAYDTGKPPAGMIAATLTRMRKLFKAIKEAFGIVGIDTAEDVFGKIEEGKLKPSSEILETAAKAVKPSVSEKVSLAGLETPKSTAKPSLRVMRGEEKPKLKGKPSVNTVGKYFDDQILEEFGRQLDYNNPEDFARAVKIASDEVSYQLKKEKSGLDWYEEDVKEAFKQTAKIIPELKKTDNRLLFSVMAGIMSPQTNARDNWFIAAKAFQHYISTGTIPGMNPENGKLWQGGTQSPNKKVQLDFLNRMVEDMGKKKALEWLFSDHTVKEINEFRSKYGNIKSGIDGKLTDIKPGLYAFGPKVGPFVSNLNGIHDVTVDKWMTRTFNRYFGTMVDANGEIIDAPTEPQRRAVKQLVNEVAEDAGIKPYQVQSLLWFYEQRLFTEMGVPSPSYGFSDGGKKFFDDARGRGGEPSGGAASEAVEPKRLSLRTFKDLFDKAADIPQSEGVEIIRENWIGGVSGIGERNSAYDLPRVEGGRQYMNDVQDLIRNELGDTFKGYRLMHVDELEEIMSGSMGSDLASFTLLPEVAQKFSSVAALGDIPRDQLAVVEMNLTPEHIWMFGHRGEREVVVNYGEGYSTAEVIATPLEGEKPSLRTPETPQFKFWFGNSKVVDENGEPKVMYHGTGKDYEILSTARRAAGAIFVSDEPQFAEKFAKDTFARASSEAATGVGIDDETFKQGVDRAIAQIRKDYGRDPMGRTLVAEVRKGYNEANAEAQEYLRNAFKDVMPAGPNIIPVYIKSEYPFDYENDEHVAAVRRVSKTKLTAEALKTGHWEAIEDNEIQAAIRVLGFDGFYVKEQGKRSLGVYDPNQVKSVFNEAPTERPELRMSLRAPETAEFKRWFGDSKVADADGNPLVVYHGTRSDFAVFEKSDPRDAGYWFGRANEANQYAASSNGGGQVMPVYLSIQNPKIYYNRDVKITPSLVQELKNQGYDGVIRDFAGGEDAWRYAVGQKEYAVFDSNQIKSAIGNVGTYDPESSDIRRSLRGSITPQLEKTLNKIVPKTYRPNRFQRILDSISGDGFTAARAQIVNRYEALARLDRAVAQQIKQAGGIQQLADQKAESAALFSDLGAGLLETAMGAHDRWGGVPVFRNGMTTISNFGGKIKGPIRIFKPLSDLKDPDAFRMYQLWSSVKRGKRLTVEGRESAIDAADIAVVDAFATNPGNANIVKLFERVQKDWLAYNDALVKFMEDTGVISKAMGKAFTEHGDYFPFYRLANDQDVVGPKMFTSIGNVKPPKKLKGGEAPLGDFFENIVLNSRAAIQAGIKNVASQRATQQALRVQGVVRLASQPTVKQTGANSWDVFDGNLKIGEVDAGSLQDAQLAADRQHKRPSSIQINMYRVMEKGNEVFYRSADPLFIDALKSLNMPDLPFLGALFSGPANLLRNLVTKDPAFMLANMMRDSLAAYVTTGVNMTPVVDTLKNFTVAIAGKSPEMQRLYAAGVLGGYDYSVKSKDAAATFEKRLREVSGAKTIGETLATPFTSLWGALEKGTQASDAATRIEMYKKTLAKTGNEAEAYWQALEVMNFNRHGSNPVIRIMTAAIPFLNARMQGLDLLYRKAIYPIYGKDATDAEIQNMKTFWVRGMTMASLSVLYWMMVHDDEDYKSQEQETRDNYWFVPGLGIKIPIPFEIGVLFKVVPERIAELAWGEDTSKDFRDSMTRNLINTFRINPIPQAVLPLYETIVDKSLYTGRAIVSRGMENIAPEYQIGPNTSRIAEVAGKAVGYSPMKIDHLIRGYTGTLGQYMADLIGAAYEVSADNPKPSKRIEQLPIIRRFATDPEARGKLTAFYELKNAVDEAVRTSNMLEKTMQLEELIKYQEDNAQILAMQDYIKDLDKSLKELRDTRKEILSMPMDPDDKRDTLVSIGQMERMLVDNIKDLRAMAFK